MKAAKAMSPAAVAVFEQAFGATWRKGPIPTALDVLSHDLRLAGAWQAPRLPEPALAGGTEVPMLWTRKLEPDELERRWVVGFDKHAAYLGVLGGLELGIGDPRHSTMPWLLQLGGTLPLSYSLECVKLPGYWRVTCNFPPPDPCFPDPLGRPRRKKGLSSEGFWITTPTLELAIEAGLEVDVLESWTWPTHRRLLSRFGDRCHKARRTLALDAMTFADTSDVESCLHTRNAALEAQRSLKAVYGATLGGFFGRVADRKRDPRPPWYRPDWRHHIIAKARANLWRNLATYRAHGLEPIGIFNDAVYYATTDSGVAAQGRIPLNDSLGGYSVGHARRLSEVVVKGRLSWPRLFGRV